jgi:hypothetical protein
LVASFPPIEIKTRGHPIRIGLLPVKNFEGSAV